MKLLNKIAIVTGAASGIGRAIALRLAEEGAQIVIIDVNQQGAEQTAGLIIQNSGKAIFYQADIRDSSRVRQIMSSVLQEKGRIDILINNAGIYYQLENGSNQRTLFVDAEESTWRLMLEINLLGTMIVTQAVLPNMIENKKGKIINIGSVAGINGIKKMVDYSVSKSGIITFTRALALEVSEHQINVNCVSPGSIDVGRGGPQTFLKRFGKPEEVAHLVNFLATDESDFITGQNFIIDGGRVLSMNCEERD